VPMAEDFDAPDKGGEERVIAFESRDELTKILNKLPPEKQRVLELKYLDGFSYKEIAEMLGEKELNLRVMVSRTLKELRKLSDFPSLIRRGKGR
ncbi:MAG: sigma-70 family RNA polymerase sigma factor, partial [Patescibacteria group bacterium]